jgi:hypothetical protein
MFAYTVYRGIREGWLEEPFLPMAEKTGTLWEHKHNAASCDHGFASFVAVVIKLCEENL